MVRARETARLQRRRVQLFERYGGVCGICRKPLTLQTMKVDHDHSCGRAPCLQCIRGILCQGCNTGLGKLGDSVEGLQRAIDYLTR